MIRALQAFLMLLGIVGALTLAIGFYQFAQNVQALKAPSPLPEADGVVALTGGTTERLSTAMQLLEAGRGRRLLISGVNPRVTDEELHAVVGGPEALFACCVDAGRLAEDTLGNASETAAWAERNGFHTLIVVTDDYHMPRSLVELRIAMPDVRIIPYPVETRLTTPGAWQREVRAAGQLASEYVKYLVIRGREGLLALDQDLTHTSPNA